MRKNFETCQFVYYTILLIYCFWTIFIFKHIFCLPKKPQYLFFSDDLFANLFNANKLYYVVFLYFFCIHLFHTFIMVQVFQGPGFSESRFFRDQVFLVQVQCLGPGFRSSFKKGVFKNFATFTGKHLCWSFFLIKFLSLSEADQSFLQKEPAEFLQPEEISFQLLNNLHYIDKFYLEVHRLFHPSTRQHTF